MDGDGVTMNSVSLGKAPFRYLGFDSGIQAVVLQLYWHELVVGVGKSEGKMCIT